MTESYESFFLNFFGDTPEISFQRLYIESTRPVTVF